MTFETLDKLAQAITGPALNAALNWAASGCAVRSLASEIHDAATRISGLVAAIKGFTHMDQAMVAEPVDRSGFEQYRHRPESKGASESATVVVQADPIFRAPAASAVNSTRSGRT